MLGGETKNPAKQQPLGLKAKAALPDFVLMGGLGNVALDMLKYKCLIFFKIDIQFVAVFEIDELFVQLMVVVTLKWA